MNKFWENKKEVQETAYELFVRGGLTIFDLGDELPDDIINMAQFKACNWLNNLSTSKTFTIDDTEVMELASFKLSQEWLVKAMLGDKYEWFNGESLVPNLYTVRIVETLATSRVVKARSKDEARALVKRQYNDSNIILDANNHIDTKFEIRGATATDEDIIEKIEPASEVYVVYRLKMNGRTYDHSSHSTKEEAIRVAESLKLQPDDANIEVDLDTMIDGEITFSETIYTKVV